MLNELKRNKISFRKLLSKKQMLIVGLFFIGILVILLYTFLSPNYYKSNGPIKIEISEGMPLSKIVDTLYSHQIIPSKRNFKIAVLLLGAEKRLKSGRYAIPNGLSYSSLIDYIVSGHGDLLKSIKIYPGTTLNNLASKFKIDLHIDSAAFQNLCNDKRIIDSLGLAPAKSLEGFLLPGNYSFFEKSSPEDIIFKMYSRFNTFVNDSLESKPKYGSYTLFQRVIMASIVAGETNKSTEMPIIAGVYFNRLKKSMKLQADPTVQYLLPKWRRLLHSDLKIHSPYNTYLYSGLPLGPINNPGKEALKAAFAPDSNNYLFFVADGKGFHKFSSTYAQHLKNVEEYRKWLESQKK